MLSLIWICINFQVILADVLFDTGYYFVSFDEKHNYEEALRFCGTLHDYKYKTRLLFREEQNVTNYLPYWLEGRENGKILNNLHTNNLILMFSCLTFSHCMFLSSRRSGGSSQDFRPGSF